MARDAADHKDHKSWSRFDFFKTSVDDPFTDQEVDCYIGYYWTPASRGTWVDGYQVSPDEPAEIEEIVLMDKDGYYSERLSNEYADDDQILDACREHTARKFDY